MSGQWRYIQGGGRSRRRQHQVRAFPAVARIAVDRVLTYNLSPPQTLFLLKKTSKSLFFSKTPLVSLTPTPRFLPLPTKTDLQINQRKHRRQLDVHFTKWNSIFKNKIKIKSKHTYSLCSHSLFPNEIFPR